VTERLFVLSLAQSELRAMEKKYWIRRKRSATAMARAATTSEARLIHYELAGRYSIHAAQSLPVEQGRGKGERAVLHTPPLDSPGEARWALRAARESS
jgi:hypothetical protein